MSLPFETKINIPFGQLGATVKWCTQNCQKDWAFDTADDDTVYVEGDHSGQYEFKFASERDYIAFLLWKK